MRHLLTRIRKLWEQHRKAITWSLLVLLALALLAFLVFGFVVPMVLVIGASQGEKIIKAGEKYATKRDAKRAEVQRDLDVEKQRFEDAQRHAGKKTQERLAEVPTDAAQKSAEQLRKELLDGARDE